MAIEDIPRVQIAHLPTPIEELPRLSQALGGPRLLVKRDDQTGLATGGNKTRKLEFLVADALEKGADTLITTGAGQSNHARQTAAAAAKFGLRSVLVLRGEEPEVRSGNLLLDDLVGAEVCWIGEGADPREEMERAAEDLRQAGRKPYIIPVGGSNPIGATGYVQAMLEAMEQLREMGMEADRMVCASGSAGTQAGLAAGAEMAGYEGQVIGISVSPTKDVLIPRVRELAQATLKLLGHSGTLTVPVIVYDDYLGEGYAKMGPPEREAIRLVARQEGLILDPVYTGRAMAGLIDLIQRGVMGKEETVLFWHTGGTPALFVYAEKF